MSPRALAIAPSGPVGAETLDWAEAAAEREGIELLRPEGWRDVLLDRDRYLAGEDAARARALQRALDLEPDALWMLRGGYGAIRTLDRAASLGLAPFARAPVPLWGFSDGTTLLAAWDRHGWPAWHAPPLTQLATLDRESRATVTRVWQTGVPEPLEGLRAVAAGGAEAPLAGGNLCVLASLAGTPWAPSFDGRILLLEDRGEAAYRVDRALTQLRLAGALDGVRGVVLGRFLDVGATEVRRIHELLAAETARLGVPVAADLPVGHGVRNLPLPFGAGSGWRARLDAGDDGTARLDFVADADPASAAEAT